MSEGNDQEQGQEKKRLSLRSDVKKDVGRTVDAGSIRQSFSHGRTKVVQVEVRKKRSPISSHEKTTGNATNMARKPTVKKTTSGTTGKRSLTAAELATRQRVLAENKSEEQRKEAERKEQEKILILSAAEEARKKEEEKRKQEIEAIALAKLEAEKELLKAAEAASESKKLKKETLSDDETKSKVLKEDRKSVV